MATKTGSKKKAGAGAQSTNEDIKHRNPLGVQKRLGFALAGMITMATRRENGPANESETMTPLESEPEVIEARAALAHAGYADLKPIGERVADLNAEIKKALDNGDADKAMELTKKLKRVKSGRE